MDSITLNITGMTCGGCVKNIEKTLNQLEGIDSFTIDLPLQQAVIYYDNNIINTESIINNIEEIGFDATIN